MSDNPLSASRPRPAEPKPDPMMRHAQLWQHMSQQPADTLQAHVQFADYALPIMGRLAGNPDVKAKDIIKAVTSAVADGKMKPSEAVSAIAGMPADPEKLRPWLKERYMDSLMATVHAKAELLKQASAGPQQGAPAAPPAPVPGAMP